MKTPKQLMEHLVDRAMYLGHFVAYPQTLEYKRWLDKGNTKLPDHLKPGYEIENLTLEQRELLSKLTSPDIYPRPDYVCGTPSPQRRSSRWALNTQNSKNK